MAKSKATISIDPHIWERSKREYDSASRRIEELLKKDLEANEMENTDLLEGRLEELEGELEDKEDKKKEVEEKLEELRQEKNVIEAKIEEKKAEEEKKEADFERFKRILGERKGDGSWKEPGDINDYWVEQLGRDKEELWEIES